MRRQDSEEGQPLVPPTTTNTLSLRHTYFLRQIGYLYDFLSLCVSYERSVTDGNPISVGLVAVVAHLRHHLEYTITGK